MNEKHKSNYFNAFNICYLLTSFSVYAETNTLKASILNDYSFDGNSISEYAEDSVNTILDTTASTNFIANEINFDDTTFNKGISDLLANDLKLSISSCFMYINSYQVLLSIEQQLLQHVKRLNKSLRLPIVIINVRF